MTSNPTRRPHDPASEKALLGAMLLDATQGAKRRNEIISVITAEDFWLESHRLIFRAWLKTTGDIIEIARALKDTGDYESAGGAGYISSLSSCAPTAVNWRHYADIVRRDAKRRDGLDACEAAQAKLLADDSDPVEIGGELLREVAASIGDNRGATRWDQSQILSNVVNFAEEKQKIQESGGATSMPCGIVGAGGISLGEAIPVYRGQLTLLGGSGGSGKTTVAMQMLMAAAKSGHRGSFISIELKQIIAAMRSVCRGAGLSERRLLDGRLTDQDMARLYAHVFDSRNWPMFIDRPLSGHWPLVERAIRAAAAGDGAEFIVVDHLHRCRWPEVSRDRRGQFIAMSQSAADLAAELNVGILLLVQLVKIPKEEIPNENHIKEASDIIEAADWATLIHRPGLGGSATDIHIDFRDGKARFDGRETSRRFGWQSGAVCDLSKVIR